MPHFYPQRYIIRAVPSPRNLNFHPRSPRPQQYYLPQNNIRAIPQVVAKVESLSYNPIGAYSSGQTVSSTTPQKYLVKEYPNEEVEPVQHKASQYRDHEHDEKGGTHHEDSWHKSIGEKSDKEYESDHQNKKGEKGEYSESEESHSESEEGGKKKQYHDSEEKHGSHGESKKGSKEGKLKENKSHKKGSKTSGYHNVFHKDEYKKDHTFYDTADHKGDFHKFGSDSAAHHKKHGETKKGHKQNSAGDEKHRSKKGSSSKGHFDKEDSDYDKKAGHDEHESNEQEYKKSAHTSEEYAHKRDRRELHHVNY